MAGGATLRVRVSPRASRDEVAGERDGALVVRLTAPPVDGAANEELIDVLAAALGVPKRAITIVAGARSRQKRVHVTGVGVEMVRRAVAGDVG